MKYIIATLDKHHAQHDCQIFFPELQRTCETIFNLCLRSRAKTDWVERHSQKLEQQRFLPIFVVSTQCTGQQWASQWYILLTQPWTEEKKMRGDCFRCCFFFFYFFLLFYDSSRLIRCIFAQYSVAQKGLVSTTGCPCVRHKYLHKHFAKKTRTRQRKEREAC